MEPREVINRLKKEGYIARQSQSSQSFFLNLGGPQSVIHRSDFKGLVVINKRVIFGTRQTSEIVEFRNTLMEEKDGKWVKRKNVPPVTGENDRIDIRLLDNAMPESNRNARIACKVGETFVNLNGYKTTVRFNNSQYEWKDIEIFLETISDPTFQTEQRWLQADEAESPSWKENSSYSPLEHDRRTMIERQICERRGQTGFRNSLRKRYGNRCLVTGCEVLAVLEAAHISPYRGEEDNHPDNGLLLRADIHTLYDLNLLGIEPATLRIELHPEIAKNYGSFSGNQLDCRKGNQPSYEALRLRYSKFMMRCQEGS